MPSTPGHQRLPAHSPTLAPDDERTTRVREVLRETYFPWLVRKYFPERVSPAPANAADGYLATDQGRHDLDNHAFARMNDCIQWIVPWVSRHADIARADVAEIGCGTGSSTAAFALACRSIHAYDIDDSSILAAQGRFDALGLTNANAERVDAATLLPTLERNHAGGVDALLCYAVLEHCTLDECLATLSRGWALVRSGGVMVVADTPNRLTYFDGHTAMLPFFSMLPAELAIQYADRSPRQDLAASLRDARERSLP